MSDNPQDIMVLRSVITLALNSMARFQRCIMQSVHLGRNYTHSNSVAITVTINVSCCQRTQSNCIYTALGQTVTMGVAGRISDICGRNNYVVKSPDFGLAASRKASWCEGRTMGFTSDALPLSVCLFGCLCWTTYMHTVRWNLDVHKLRHFSS